MGRFLFVIFAAISLDLLSTSARANNEVLSFRLNFSGEVEAVLTGVGGVCGTFTIGPPTSVTITGTSISIVSPPPTPLLCPTPIGSPPPPPYSVVANLGILTGATYTVTWSPAATAILTPASLVPAPIPTLGSYALVLMAVTIFLVGANKIGVPHGSGNACRPS
jgi:hypothetical protein